MANCLQQVGPFERIEQDYQIHMAVDEVRHKAPLVALPM